MQATCQDSFETSPPDGESEEAVSKENDDSAPATSPPSPPPPPPPVPKTVAEKLELVKVQEAELLRQFEETHKRSAQARSGVGRVWLALLDRLLTLAPVVVSSGFYWLLRVVYLSPSLAGTAGVQVFFSVFFIRLVIVSPSLVG